MTPTIIVFLIMFGLLILAVRLSLGLARRAICRVISTFRVKNATDPQLAITPEELGIRLVPPLFSMGLRDYKPWAFQTLVKADIIQQRLDGTFFLSEKQLEQARGIKCADKTSQQVKM